ncbi:MAG: hypothetical protein HY754_11405 [Nitrospirae bacterium]|nr:hypothetical protein [Nitrospirota bacterium]
MHSLLCSLLTVVFLFGLSAYTFASDDSGTFRGKWWNYYERGITYSEKEDAENAINDLKKAISMRSKDQRMARTYGMHFVDYFPHRELGIIYLDMGKIDKAIPELEESIRGEESAKAIYYLNKARKVSLLKQKDRLFSTPAITIESPSERGIIKDLSIKIKGRVSGEGFISKILINNTPFRFELAKKEIEFEKEFAVDDGENRIVITTEDLLGNISEKTMTVTVDREGPTINIFDILPEEKEGRKFVRITGEVNDSTGIRNVVINDKTIAVNNSKAYEFDMLIPRDISKNPPIPPLPKGGEGRFVIHASDSLDNETKAELDIEKEVIAVNKKSEPVLLAFNASGIFSFDKEPPIIKLKDIEGIPPVFVDKYYVEGEVFDNKRVDKVLINNVEIPTKKGKKIFFGKTVKLDKEGDNRIIVNALDSSDNKTTSELKIKRNIPDVMQVGSRMKITLLPFENKNLAYEHLIGSFVNQKRFGVVEREKLEQILIEHKIRDKLADPKYAIMAGRLMAADAILATAINEKQKSIEIISRVINTETSEVMEVKDVFTEDKSLSSVKELMDGLASKIAVSFPIVKGMVIKRSGKEIYSDIGDTSKIRRNMGVIIYREGKEIKHHVSGKSLGRDTIKLGEGHIEDMQENFSKIKLSGKSRADEINVKDLIITK